MSVYFVVGVKTPSQTSESAQIPLRVKEINNDGSYTVNIGPYIYNHIEVQLSCYSYNISA